MSTTTKRAVPGIPLAALSAIDDPNVRDVLQAIVDTHHVRNGQAGDGDERFVTAKEVGLAKGQAGRPGAAGQGGAAADGTPLRPTDVGRIVTELQAQIIESPLFKLLGQRLSMLDAPHGVVAKISEDLLTAANNALAEFDAETGGQSNGATDLTQIMDGVVKSTRGIKTTLYDPKGALPLASAAILAIDTVTTSSTSANAKALAGVRADFYDASTGLAASRTEYVHLIDAEATARKAVGALTEVLSAQVNDAATGLAASRTDYVNRINLEATARGAVASSLAGLTATVIDPTTGRPYTEALIADARNIELTNATALANQTNGVYASLGTKSRSFFLSTPPPQISAIAGSPYVPASQGRSAVAAVPPRAASPAIDDIWYDTSNKNIAKRWTGSAWVDASDARTATSEGAITNETGVRLAQDNAIVTAIKTVWGALGGNAGLIQGGDTITVNTAGAQATSFNQVQAALKDGNGNLISSATIKQTTDTLVSKSGQVESKWVVDLDSGGAATGWRQAGFGIVGSTSANGPVYSFGVRADSFWIAAPGQTSGAAVPAANVPFIVRTANWTDSQGVLQPPGVFLNELFATTAKIGYAQIQMAMIGEAQISTLKLAGTSVTVGVYDSAGANTIAAGGVTSLIRRTVDLGDGYNTGVVVGGVVAVSASSDATFGIRVVVNGVVAGDIRGSLHSGYVTLAPVTGFLQSTGRYAVVDLQVYSPTFGGGANVALNIGASNISIMGAKR